MHSAPQLIVVRRLALLVLVVYAVRVRGRLALAERDYVTSALTRRAFLRAADRAARSRGGWCVVVDVDGFKRVNDTLGHAAGDVVLAEVARVLGEYLGARALLCRLGGDEFAAFTTDAELAESLPSALACSVEWSGHKVALTASVGKVRTEPGRAAVSAALAVADGRMYAVKQGRAA